MTESEYMDPRRFPLTTQEGLSLDGQMLIDAVNLDELDRDVENGATLTAEEQQVAGELNAKRPFIAAAGRITQQGGGP